MIRHALLALILCSVLVYALPPKKQRLYLIGDSTMSEKEPKAFPETGWGMPFKYFFNEFVQMENRAKNGRSTRTFIEENLWSGVYSNLREGDVVLIQFGHNDEVKEKVERYTSPEEYKNNLKKFVNESRAKRAVPILLTPVSRRKFDKQGIAMETHQEYSALVRALAIEVNVPLIDLDKLSLQMYQQLGEEKSKLLFLHLEAGEHPNYPEGKEDNTHFSELGARKIAQLVINEIIHLNLGLEQYVLNHQ